MHGPGMERESGGSRRLLIYAAAAAILLAAPHLMPTTYWLRIYAMTGIYVMLALGLNVVAGFAGLLDLAYVAFFGMGAYIFALLSSDHFGIHLPFLATLPIAAFATMGVGFALGSTCMRLKGEYLAIVTLAFAQIFKLLLVNLDRPINITGGVDGIHNLDPIRFFGFTLISPVAYAYLIWPAVLVVIIGCFRLKRSHYGRGWEAIREDELAAEAMGVNTSMMKLKAFAGGAFIAGATGALFASFQDSVFPNNFDFPQLVIVYCMVILGGLGNVAGVILGAVLLSILPEFLREYGAYRMMFYGPILVVLMALRPQGIMGTKKRPGRDEPGVVKTSTDLCDRQEGRRESARKGAYCKGENVVLEIKEVSLNFGGIIAVDNVSFDVYENEILSIIGPNGAGKTTLFNMISGFYPTMSGAILYKGKNLLDLKPHKIVRAGIARTFQNLRLFNNMTVMENTKVARFCRARSGFLSILLHLPLYWSDEREMERNVEEALALFGERLTGNRFTRQALSLSHGDRRRLEIARAIATGGKVLMLDEPSAGMNPQETEEITEFIRELRDKHGFTIIVNEHKLNIVKSISDRVIALACGLKIAEGSYEELACDHRVIEACLGRERHKLAGSSAPF
jgi:branched-chain amino acid transport system permease protein